MSMTWTYPQKWILKTWKWNKCPYKWGKTAASIHPGYGQAMHILFYLFIVNFVIFPVHFFFLLGWYFFFLTIIFLSIKFYFLHGRDFFIYVIRGWKNIPNFIYDTRWYHLWNIFPEPSKNPRNILSMCNKFAWFIAYFYWLFRKVAPSRKCYFQTTSVQANIAKSICKGDACYVSHLVTIYIRRWLTTYRFHYILHFNTIFAPTPVVLVRFSDHIFYIFILTLSDIRSQSFLDFIFRIFGFKCKCIVTGIE